MKIAFSGDNLMRLRITYTNWPTVRSAGTKYFFLSIVAMSDFSTFSQITCQCDLNQSLLPYEVDMRDRRFSDVLGCGRHTSVEYALLRPCASQKDARP